MKKKLWVILLSAVLFMLAACNTQPQQPLQPPQQTSQQAVNRVTTRHQHSFGAWHIIEDATCTKFGLRERSCSCGKKESDTIAPKGHTVVVDPAVPPACMESGLTEGSHCSVCNKVIVKQKTVSQTYHDIDINTIQAGDVCSKCGYVVEEVSLNQILVSPSSYNGKLIKITEQLSICSNDPAHKQFTTKMSTGPNRYDYTNDKGIIVYYFSTSDEDKCIALNSNYQKITVYGYFQYYSYTHMLTGNGITIDAVRIIF